MARASPGRRQWETWRRWRRCGRSGGSFSRLAQIRRQALVNGQIARNLSRSYRIDEGDYAKLTAGIHGTTRMRLAAHQTVNVPANPASVER